ncbi:MAG: cyclic nucleotide-binding domain-containing protein [Polyangiaceae bacterium]|jgi:CRP-like cAMP-binding protein
MAETGPSDRVAREMFLLTLGGDTRDLGWALNRTVASLRDVFVGPGEPVYSQGDPAEEHYFLVSGEVKLTRPGAKDWIMGERSVIGSLDMLHERSRTRTATATVATHLLAMRSEDWWGLLEDRFELSNRVVLNLSAAIHALRLRPSPLGGFDETASPGGPPAGKTAGVGQRGPLNLIARTLLLRTVPIFARGSIQTLTALSEVASEVRASDGQLLFPRGALGRQLAVVVEGQVTASRDPAAPSHSFGPGALVVGTATIARGADYEVHASGATRVLAIPTDDYYDAMEDHFSLARSALVALAEERESLMDR